jgi:hypothetical protein
MERIVSPETDRARPPKVPRGMNGEARREAIPSADPYDTADLDSIPPDPSVPRSVPVPTPQVQEQERPQYADVAALLRHGIPEPPTPDYLNREDGHNLFYRGTVNILFGDPESGKSWVALAACQEALSAGESTP